MWNLDDTSKYVKFAVLELESVSTWGSPKDPTKREELRDMADGQFPSEIPKGMTWAFRIYVKKIGHKPFDIENVLKIIIDSFSTKQIVYDQSRFSRVGLYPDDTVDHVNQIQIAGARDAEKNSTEIHLFHTVRHA